MISNFAKVTAKIAAGAALLAVAGLAATAPAASAATTTHPEVRPSVSAQAVRGTTIGSSTHAPKPAGTAHGHRPADGRKNPAQIAGSYTIYNATGQTLTLANHWIDGTWDGDEPVNGTKIYPGMSYHFGVTEWFLGDDTATLDFEVGGTDEYLRAIARPEFAQGLSKSTWLNASGAYTGTVDGLYRSNLTVTSTSPEVHDLSSDQAEQQYLALKQICGDGTFAKCTFDPTVEKSTVSAPTLAGAVIPNDGETTVEDEYDWKNTTETTSEWGTEADLSAGLEGIVETSVKASYGETTAHSVSTGGSLTMPIDAGQTGWMTYQAPVERVTGNFTITVGNDTWNLSQVYFEIPKKTDGNGGVLTPHQLPNGDPGIPSGAMTRKH